MQIKFLAQQHTHMVRSVNIVFVFVFVNCSYLMIVYDLVLLVLAI